MRNVILLMIDGRYEFYSSPNSLYAKHTSDELGITQQGLNNYFHLTDAIDGKKIYKNKICTIIKADVYTEPSTRGRKKSII